MLHVLEGGSNRLWRALDRLDVSWMALCPPGTAVVHEDGVTRAGTLARRATYRMLDTTPWQHSLQTCVERPLTQLEVWLAADEVVLRRRGQADMPLRLIHVRLQDRRDGSIIRQCSALSRAALDDAVLAQQVLARLEQKWVARAVQAFWRRLTRDAAGAHPEAHQSAMRQHAALAVHLGLAAWQVLQSDQTRAARQTLRSLCASPKPSVHAIASGLLRIFALKDMLPDQDKQAMA